MQFSISGFHSIDFICLFTDFRFERMPFLMVLTILHQLIPFD